MAYRLPAGRLAWRWPSSCRRPSRPRGHRCRGPLDRRSGGAIPRPLRGVVGQSPPRGRAPGLGGEVPRPVVPVGRSRGPAAGVLRHARDWPSIWPTRTCCGGRSRRRLRSSRSTLDRCGRRHLPRPPPQYTRRRSPGSLPRPVWGWSMRRSRRRTSPPPWTTAARPTRPPARPGKKSPPGRRGCPRSPRRGPAEGVPAAAGGGGEAGRQPGRSAGQSRSRPLPGGLQEGLAAGACLLEQGG